MSVLRKFVYNTTNYSKRHGTRGNDFENLDMYPHFSGASLSLRNIQERAWKFFCPGVRVIMLSSCGLQLGYVIYVSIILRA